MTVVNVLSDVFDVKGLSGSMPYKLCDPLT